MPDRAPAPDQILDVSLLRIDAELIGNAQFSPQAWPLITNSGPLSTTAIMAANSIRFHWLAGCGVLVASSLPDEFVLAITHGAVELSCRNGSRQELRPGSLLQGSRIVAAQLRIQAGNCQPCRFAILETGGTFAGDPTASPDETGSSIIYLNNRETVEGFSYFEHRRLALRWRRGDCLMSDTIPLMGFQAVRASGTLDYDWHPAPQRQIVLVLTGGLAMEYGDGSRASLLPGEFLVGEDLRGQGHKTRALLGAERLSLFAHLPETGALRGVASQLRSGDLK